MYSEQDGKGLESSVGFRVRIATAYAAFILVLSPVALIVLRWLVHAAFGMSVFPTNFAPIMAVLFGLLLAIVVWLFVFVMRTIRKQQSPEATTGFTILFISVVVIIGVFIAFAVASGGVWGAVLLLTALYSAPVMTAVSIGSLLGQVVDSRMRRTWQGTQRDPLASSDYFF